MTKIERTLTAITSMEEDETRRIIAASGLSARYTCHWCSNRSIRRNSSTVHDAWNLLYKRNKHWQNYNRGSMGGGDRGDRLYCRSHITSALRELHRLAVGEVPHLVQTRSLHAPSHNSMVSVVRRRPRRLLRVSPTATISALGVDLCCRH